MVKSRRTIGKVSGDKTFGLTVLGMPDTSGSAFTRVTGEPI